MLVINNVVIDCKDSDCRLPLESLKFTIVGSRAEVLRGTAKQANGPCGDEIGFQLSNRTDLM